MRLPEQKNTAFFFSDGGLLLLLWLLNLGVRAAAVVWGRGTVAVINSDAVNYLEAGMRFAATGEITYVAVPTAQIMPGMPVLIGLLAKLAPGKEALRQLCRVVWALMGSVTPLFYYKSVRLYAPKLCAFLAGCVCLMPNLVQIDGFILTECPYTLFFAMALYFTLKMGRDPAPRDVWLYALSVLGALLFRANVLALLPLTLLYLRLTGCAWRVLAKRALAVCLVLALFIVPWTIRNARVFHAFIPISYGSGSPLLEGSYQGPYAPTDEEIAAVYGPFSPEEAVRREHPELFDEQGELADRRMKKYYALLLDSAAAKHRLGCWLRMDPAGFLRNNLIFKLRYSLNYVWFYDNHTRTSWALLHRLRQVNCLFCGLSLALAFALKKHRRVLSFLALAYAVSFAVIAGTYAGDRYAQAVMGYRYVWAGIGLDLIGELLRRLPARREAQSR